jgi:cardiolipin synthase A/B
MQYTIYSTSHDAWEAMRIALDGACESIYWELYIFIDDEEGGSFFDLLSRKASAGLDVKLIIDGWGSISVSRKRIEALRKSGVDVRVFHERKFRYRGVWQKIVSRTHRKILIVDGNVGFIGGVNIKKQMRDWLDLHVRIEGKAVRSMLRAFAKMYMICGGPRENVVHLLKHKFRIDMSDVDFIYDEAGARGSKMRRRYTEALRRAKKRVIFFSPYYFPDLKFIEALWRARRRGVRVDLLIPFRSDMRIVTYAAYTWFAIMARRGVHVHMLDTMMHGKGVIVDNDYAIVGSSNLEHTSFYDNYEANARFRNKRFVRDVKRIMKKWIEKSKKFNIEEWENRGKIRKLKEWMAMKLYKGWHRKRWK